MEFGILTIVHSEDDDLVTTFIKNVAMLTLREKLWKMSHSLTEKMSAGGDTNLSSVVTIGKKLGVDPTMLLQKQDPTPLMPLDLDKEPWHGVWEEPSDLPEEASQEPLLTQEVPPLKQAKYARRDAIFEILQGGGKTAKDIQDLLTDVGLAYGGKAPQNTASAALIHMVKKDLLISRKLFSGSRTRVFYLPNCPSLKANEKELREALVRRVLLEVEASPSGVSAGDVVRALSQDKPGECEPRADFIGNRPRERCRRLLSRLVRDGILDVTQDPGGRQGCVAGTMWFSMKKDAPEEVPIPEVPKESADEDYLTELQVTWGS